MIVDFKRNEPLTLDPIVIKGEMLKTSLSINTSVLFFMNDYHGKKTL